MFRRYLKLCKWKTEIQFPPLGVLSSTAPVSGTPSTKLLRRETWYMLLTSHSHSHTYLINDKTPSVDTWKHVLNYSHLPPSLLPSSSPVIILAQVTIISHLIDNSICFLILSLPLLLPPSIHAVIVMRLYCITPLFRQLQWLPITGLNTNHYRHPHATWWDSCSLSRSSHTYQVISCLGAFSHVLLTWNKFLSALA